MEGTKKIAFLCYINRSGSTYLSKLLNKYKAVGVTIEGGNLPDGIGRKELVIENKKEIRKKFKVLEKNEKFRHWNILESDFEKLVERINKFPLTFSEIFPFIMDLYFKKAKKMPDVMVYKCGWLYLKHFSLIKRKYRDAKMIFIIRDGRAIYNSQVKSLSSIKRKRMSDSPIRTAKLYKKVVKLINNYKDFKNFLVIKYENLLLDKEKVLSSILDFLEIEKREIYDYSYEQFIPEEQKHLHKNLGKPPLTERIDAWKRELKKEEIFVFQFVSKKSLELMGYKEEKIEFPIYKKILLLIKYYVDYYLKRFKDKFNAFKDFDYLFNRIWYRLFFRNSKR